MSNMIDMMSPTDNVVTTWQVGDILFDSDAKCVHWTLPEVTKSDVGICCYMTTP